MMRCRSDIDRTETSFGLGLRLRVQGVGQPPQLQVPLSPSCAASTIHLPSSSCSRASAYQVVRFQHRASLLHDFSASHCRLHRLPPMQVYLRVLDQTRSFHLRPSYRGVASCDARHDVCDDIAYDRSSGTVNPSDACSDAARACASNERASYDSSWPRCASSSLQA